MFFAYWIEEFLYLFIDKLTCTLMLLQHAVVFVNGDQYYGAKASINVWAPRVTDEFEFSLSQMWVIAGSFGKDLNTIEAGWQACPYFLNYPTIYANISLHSYLIYKFSIFFFYPQILIVSIINFFISREIWTFDFFLSP